MKFTAAAAAVLSANFAALASAFTTPVGANPSGNPIYKPNLGDIVPKGQPYTITWNPTSSGTVTLVLLRGPSTNVVPLAPIVEKIPNSGSYEWTPDSSLEADTSRYGIQLIQDSDGAYQYSTQFGIGESSGSSSSVTVTPTDSISKAAVTDYSSSTGAPTATESMTATTTTAYHTQTVCTSVCAHNNTTTVTTSSSSYSHTSVSTASSSTALTNVTTHYTTTAQPTTLRSSTAPSSSLLPSSSSAPANASSTSLPPAGSAAGQLAISFGSAMMIGVAGFLVAVC